MMNDKELQSAKAAAYRLLSFRDRSCHEIQSRLCQKGYCEEVIDNVLEGLKYYNYINDERFACQWIRYRLETKPMGEFRLRQELKEKGIMPSVIDTAFEHEFPFQSQEEMALALLKQRYGNEEDYDKTMKRRMGGFLQRRGFSYRVIHKVITQYMKK